jgi:hypothetical protein
MLKENLEAGSSKFLKFEEVIEKKRELFHYVTGTKNKGVKMGKIKALIFDFDGLILDTEMPRYIAWSELYLKYNCNLSLLEYSSIVGSDDTNFDFYGYKFF